LIKLIKLNERINTITFIGKVLESSAAENYPRISG
jgi:hypothetical protein